MRDVSAFMMSDPNLIWRSLGRSTLHVLLNATGIIPLFYFSAHMLSAPYPVESPPVQADIGIFGGIVLFVTIYTVVLSSSFFNRCVPVGDTLRQALRGGTWILSTISALGCVCFLIAFNAHSLEWLGIVGMPDFFSALYAFGLAEHLVPLGGQTETSVMLRMFLFAVAQGIFLSLMLLLLSSICWVFLWLRKRWKAKALPSSALT